MLRQATDGRGAALVVAGEPGIGKTTLLDMITGFTRQRSGIVLLDGIDVLVLVALFVAVFAICVTPALFRAVERLGAVSERWDGCPRGGPGCREQGRLWHG